MTKESTRNAGLIGQPERDAVILIHVGLRALEIATGYGGGFGFHLITHTYHPRRAAWATVYVRCQTVSLAPMRGVAALL